MTSASGPSPRSLRPSRHSAALPELAVSDVDLGVEFAGVKLKAPLVMAAMTGGVDRADIINRELAQVAEELGIGFAYGSQRPLLAQGYRGLPRTRCRADSTRAR